MIPTSLQSSLFSSFFIRVPPSSSVRILSTFGSGSGTRYGFVPRRHLVSESPRPVLTFVFLLKPYINPCYADFEEKVTHCRPPVHQERPRSPLSSYLPFLPSLSFGNSPSTGTPQSLPLHNRPRVGVPELVDSLASVLNTPVPSHPFLP